MSGPTLWLIGMMGSGKSTVAALVAETLGMEMVDTDAEVEAATGRAVGDLFAEGEEGFRGHEREAVLGVAGRAAVVACGGGVVLDPTLVEVMRRTGLVVWLDAPVAVLAARVGDGEGRPLLGSRPEADLGAIVEGRRAFYGEAAHVVVDAAPAPEAVATEVVRAWSGS